MADLFGIKSVIKKHDAEKEKIDIFKTIIAASEIGKTNITICYPVGANPYLLNSLRSFGFKAHNIELKGKSKSCLIQW
jgi:hypothetical protein